MKKFVSKKPIQFELDGVVFNLPAEIPIAVQLYLQEMHTKGMDAFVTTDDLMQLFNSLLGKETSEKLINEMQIGNDTLTEILSWYMQEVSKENPKASNPKAK